MQPNHRSSNLSGYLLAACLCALAACGGEESAPPATQPAPSSPATPAPDPAVAPPAAAPEPAAPAPAAAPAGLPEDVPSYPGATAVASSQDGEEGLIVAFETGDEPEKIYQFYKDAFAKQGWALEGEMSSADQRMVIAGKDARRASVLVSVEGGKTEIAVTVTKDED